LSSAPQNHPGALSHFGLRKGSNTRLNYQNPNREYKREDDAKLTLTVTGHTHGIKIKTLKNRILQFLENTLHVLKSSKRGWGYPLLYNKINAKMYPSA
jgi:hypothetical protein